MGSVRVISLIDVDSFECQIYQNKHPQYKGKPCVVADKSGRIVSITYEAKQLGATRNDRVKDLPLWDYLGNPIKVHVFRKPQLFNKPDSSLCRQTSHEITELVMKFCSKRAITVERVPIDEWFLDLTNNVNHLLKNHGVNCIPYLKDHSVYLESKQSHTQDSLTQKRNWLVNTFQDYTEEEKLIVGASIVKKLTKQIFNEMGFSCSAGISTNKLLAKQACKLRKRDHPKSLNILSSLGLKRISPLIQIRDIWGLGGELGEDVEKKLPHVETMADLRKFSKRKLKQFFGQADADFLYDRARGICHEDVLAKVISHTVNCSKANLRITNNKELRFHLNNLSEDIVQRLREEQTRHARYTHSLKIQFHYHDESDGEDSEVKPIERSFNYDGENSSWIAQTCFLKIRNWGFNPYNKNYQISELKLTAKNFTSSTTIINPILKQLGYI